MVPAIVVISPEDPLLRKARAGEARNDVIGGYGFVVEVEGQADPRGPWAKVIGEGQLPEPACRGDLAPKGLQQRRRIGVGQGQNGDRGERFHFL